jgi:hypothetical protein
MSEMRLQICRSVYPRQSAKSAARIRVNPQNPRLELV